MAGPDRMKEESLEEVPLKEKKDAKDKNFVSKLQQIRSSITVEPVLFGISISNMIDKLAIQDLNLDKSCRVKLNFNNSICNGLMDKKGNLTMFEADVQKVVSNIESWKSVIQTAIPLLLVIFMGAWSDRTGNRKVCNLMPIFGKFMVCISNLLSTYFFDQISIEVTMFCEAIFPAITGNWVLIFVGVFSYVADIIDEESRTFRVGLVNVCMTTGNSIGTALSGILLKLWGYYGVFAFAGLMYILSFFYGFYYLDNNTKPRTDKSGKVHVKPAVYSELVTLVKETGEVVLKKRQKNYRKQLLLNLLVLLIMYGPTHSESPITYLYVRYILNWNAVQYSIYYTYSIITHLLVPLVEILNATPNVFLRSLGSKLISSDEIGKFNSMFSLVQTLSALIFNPIYFLVYSHSLTVFNAAVYVFSASLLLPAVVILVWFFMQHRREVREKKRMQTRDIEVVYESVSEN